MIFTFWINMTIYIHNHYEIQKRLKFVNKCQNKVLVFSINNKFVSIITWILDRSTFFANLYRCISIRPRKHWILISKIINMVIVKTIYLDCKCNLVKSQRYFFLIEILRRVNVNACFRTLFLWFYNCIILQF